ncbi:MAG: hypothetical protein R3C56_20050 [Pirellulaceae bacterium]
MDSQSTEAHLETCAICQSRLAELAGEEQLSRDAGTSAPPPKATWTATRSAQPFQLN